MVRHIYQSIVILFALYIGVSARADDSVPGEVLVHLRPHTNIQLFNLMHGTHTRAKSAFTSTFRLSLPVNADQATLIQRMLADDSVLAVDTNLCISAHGFAPPKLQWVYTANGSDGPVAYSGQSSIALVNYGTIAQRYSGSGVTVAILDTGISTRNATLAQQVLPGWNFVNYNSDTDDRPYGLDSNFNGVNDDEVGHGTMVAGIVARFAPDANLLPVRVLDSEGQGTLWGVVQGIYYAVWKGANVINLSFGSLNQSNLLKEALHYAQAQGVLVVSSAGNSGSDVPIYPANYGSTIAVASLNDDRTKADFSSYGKNVDLDAPGVAIVSTYWDGRYAAWSGTSFSAPMVSAEAALIVSARPDISVTALRSRLTSTSHSVDEQNPNYVGQLGWTNFGLIDMDLALSDL